MQDNNQHHSRSRPRPIQGLPVVCHNVAGVDLGSERHWVCTPTRDRSAREIASFAATTTELFRISEWLKAAGRGGGHGM